MNEKREKEPINDECSVRERRHCDRKDEEYKREREGQGGICHSLSYSVRRVSGRV